MPTPHELIGQAVEIMQKMQVVGLTDSYEDMPERWIDHSIDTGRSNFSEHNIYGTTFGSVHTTDKSAKLSVAVGDLGPDEMMATIKASDRTYEAIATTHPEYSLFAVVKRAGYTHEFSTQNTSRAVQLIAQLVVKRLLTEIDKLP